MPTKFYTLFGNNVHGIKATWQNDPTITGDRTLTLDFDLHMYAAKPTFGLVDTATPQLVNGVSTYAEPWTTLGWGTLNNSPT